MSDVSDMLRAGLARLDAAFQRRVHPDIISSVNRAFLLVTYAIERLEEEEPVEYPRITSGQRAGDHTDEGPAIPAFLKTDPEPEWTIWRERSDTAFVFARDYIISHVDQWYYIKHGIPCHSALLGQAWLPPANHPALYEPSLWDSAPKKGEGKHGEQGTRACERKQSPFMRRCIEICYSGLWRVRAGTRRPDSPEHSLSKPYSDSDDLYGLSEGGTEETIRPPSDKENKLTNLEDAMDSSQGTTKEQEGIQGERSNEHPTLNDLHLSGNRARVLPENHPARRFEKIHPRAPYAPEVLRRRELTKSPTQVKVNTTTTTTVSRATPPFQHPKNTHNPRQNARTHHRDTQETIPNMTNTNVPPFQEELRLVPSGSENAQPTVRGLIEERKELSEYQPKTGTEERTPVYQYTPKPANTSRIPTLAGAHAESSPKKKFSDHFTRKAASVEEPLTGPVAPKAKALLGSPMVKSGPSFSGPSFFRRTSSARVGKNSGTSSSEPSPVKEDFKTPATPIRAAATSTMASANVASAHSGRAVVIQGLANRPKPVQTSSSPSLMRKVSNTVIKAVSPTKPKTRLEDHPPTPPAKDTPPKADIPGSSDDAADDSGESGIVRAPLYRKDMGCSASAANTSTNETITSRKNDVRKEPQVMTVSHHVQSMSGDIVGGCDVTDERAVDTMSSQPRVCNSATTIPDSVHTGQLPARSYSPPMDTSLFYSPDNSSAQFVYSPSIYDNVRNKDNALKDDDDFEGVAFPRPSPATASLGQSESPSKEILPKVHMMECPIFLQPTTYQKDSGKRVSFTEPAIPRAQGRHEYSPARSGTAAALDFADTMRKAATRDSSDYTEYTLSPLKEDFQCPSAKPSPLRIPRRLNEGLDSSYKSLRERYADGQRAAGAGLGISTSPDSEYSDGLMAPPNSPVKEQMRSSVLRDLAKDLSDERKSRTSRDKTLILALNNFTNVIQDVRQKLVQLQELDPKALSQKVASMEGDLNKIDTIGLAMLEVAEKVEHMEDYLSSFEDRVEASLIHLAKDVVARVKEDAEATSEATDMNMNGGFEAVLERVDRGCTDVTEQFNETVSQLNDKLAVIEAKVAKKDDVGPRLWDGGRNKHR